MEVEMERVEGEELATVEVMDVRLRQDQVKVFLAITVVFMG